jgi:hypothetical protein
VAEELTDWKVQVVLDRRAIVEDITKLAQILARERIYYTVAASSRGEAIDKAKVYLQRHVGVPERYVRSLHPRRLPT